jgi:DinB superfamily
MTHAQTTDRFPIGPQPQVDSLGPQQRQEGVEALRQLPAQFRAAFAGLDEGQLGTPYRDGGWSPAEQRRADSAPSREGPPPTVWTLRQVAHHVPDSHMNAYIRTRLALSEEAPTIRPYNQDAWAALADMGGDIAVSLDLLEALHGRWTRLLDTLTPWQWARTFVHPEYGRVYTLDGMLASYVWHGRHHTAQVLNLRKQRGW